jgi:hypothetical protein
MSCRNPKSEISIENCETLETIGPKIQNVWNFTLRVSRDVLENFVLSYAKIIPNFQLIGVGIEK